MKCKEIIVLCAVVVLAVICIFPAGLSATERYGGNPATNCLTKPGNQTGTIYRIEDANNNIRPKLSSNDEKLITILLPDWRGIDRAEIPFLIKAILKPRHIIYFWMTR